jgi:drug/metabolite transporter (DMT)-like permease
MTYLVPAVAIVMGWVLLSEAPPAISFVGGAVAIGGVVLARSKPKPTPEPVLAGATAD